MEIKTRQEILISLLNDQQEVVLNREASLRMLRKMEPKQVLTVKVDMATMQPQTITVEKRLQEMEEAMVHDQARLEAFKEMLAEEQKSSV